MVFKESEAASRFQLPVELAERGPSHTLLLQELLNRPEDTLVLAPRADGAYLTGPLHMRQGGKVLVLLRGVELRALPGAFPRTKDCLLSLRGVDDVSILGYGARLVMHKQEYTQGEWRHALELRGCRRIRVQGLALDSSGGDGLYIGSMFYGGRDASENIEIRDCRMRGNRRQGISVTSARRLLLENIWVEGTAGTAPECGLDFEPDDPREYLSDCMVRNGTFIDNANHGAFVFLGKLRAASAPVSILFENCRFANSRSKSGFQLSGFRDRGVRGHVRLKRCVIEGNTSHGLVLGDKPTGYFSFEIDSCLIRHGTEQVDKGKLPGAALIVGRGEATWSVGGMMAKALQVELKGGVSLFQALRPDSKLSSISLEVKMIDAGGASTQLPRISGIHWKHWAGSLDSTWVKRVGAPTH